MLSSFGSLSAIIACAVLSYLAGSVPFGLILTKATGYGDIRTLGSGNIGATNVLRTGNKRLAFATLACDFFKGFIPVLIAVRFGSEIAATAVIFAPLGHIFPVWLNFKGGKGVATAGGALLAYLWPAALAAVATWLIVAFIFRYSSLAALAATATAPIWTLLCGGSNGQALVVLVIALIVIWRHSDNIARLRRGEEGKIAHTKKQA